MPLSATDMPAPAGRHRSLHHWPPHLAANAAYPPASDLRGLTPAGPGPGLTGRGPGPGLDAAPEPDRRGRSRRRALDEAMDLLGNDTATADSPPDSRVGVDPGIGVAEQLLIAWRHILANADGAADMAAYNASPSAANSTLGNVSLAGSVLGGDYMQLGNGTAWTEHEELVHIATMVAIAVSLGLVILATVIGNVFVIAAILLERHLQNVANYLILSLAVADLLVACLVMPLGAVYEVSQQWTLGPELCDMWTSSDVLCCTASILHLVAIALDRYWAVTNIDYIHQRTARRIGLMILVVWLVAFMVCIAPMLGWKDPGWDERVTLDQECMVSQDIAYQIFATASSFYLPLLVILGLYWRIFQTARRRIRRRVQTSAEPLAGRRRGGGGRRQRRARCGGGGHDRQAAAHHLGGHHHHHHDRLHQRVLQQHLAREDVLRQRAGGGPAHRGPALLQPLLGVAAPPLPEAQEGGHGLEARAQGRQDAGHHHGGLRHVLAALLHHGHPAARVRHVLLQQVPRLLLPVARLLQLDAQPHHLHHLQPRVPARLQAAAVRPARHAAPQEQPPPGREGTPALGRGRR